MRITEEEFSWAHKIVLEGSKRYSTNSLSAVETLDYIEALNVVASFQRPGSLKRFLTATASGLSVRFDKAFNEHTMVMTALVVITLLLVIIALVISFLGMASLII